jgi:hypothetical protein
MLVLASLACADNSGTKVEAASARNVDASAAVATSAPTVKSYKIGDVIQVQEHTIVLNEVSLAGKTLVANLTVENLGAEDVVVSSLVSFEARDGEGTPLEIDIFSCGPSLDGTVLAGDKLRGDVCWTAPNDATSFRLYYRDNIFGSGAVIWSLAR